MRALVSGGRLAYARSVGTRSTGLLLATLCAAAAGACKDDNPGQSAGPPGGEAIAIVDDRVRTVRLPRPARRIASLAPSNTEILYAIGCGERIVVRDRFSNHPPRARELPETNAFQLSPGHIAGFKPDLVLVSHTEEQRLEVLDKLGLPVAIFDPRTLPAMYRNVEAIGALCGAPGRARALVRRLRRRARTVRRRVEGRTPVRVYIEADGTTPAKPWTAGRRSMIHHLVTLAGGRNIVGDLPRPFVQVSAEEVVSRAPEVIVLMGVAAARRDAAAALRRRPGWGEVPAIEHERVIASIHRDLLSRPGPRLLDGLEALARALHPGAFRP